jgi:protein-disulfide isomerase
MRWVSVRPWVATVARVLLGVVWLYAGLSKVGDPGQFLVSVQAYQLLPDWIARAVAYGLPVLEIGVGVLLIAGLATRLAALISAFLLVVFEIGVISAAARGLSIDCGCFGSGGTVAAGQTRYAQEILRDIGLLAAAGFLACWPLSRYSVDEAITASVSGPRLDPATRRTKAARDRAAALVARQHHQIRQRLRLVTAVAAAILVAAAGIGVAVQANRSHVEVPATAASSAYSGPVSPAGSDGIVLGYPDAKVTVDLYEDFMCPICGLFESRSGAQILSLAVQHKAKLAYHMLNFLDDSSKGTQYSTRAANAAACAAEEGLPFVKFHALLYANQPKEQSTGLTDQQLIDYGVQAGVNRTTFTTCVQSRKYDTWTQQLTQQAFTTGHVQGTPTVRVGGQDVDWQDGQNVIDAVNNAATP